MVEVGVSWWSELRQNGMILSPTVLSEFVDGGPVLERWPYERLRDAYTSFISQLERSPDKSSILYTWFDTLFQGFLEHPQDSCKKHGGIPEKYRVAMSRKGAASLRPDRLILHAGDQDQPRFLVLFDMESSRLGMHRGRAVYSSFLDLLRGTGHPVGILMNGRQFRLVYAGIDYDCWVEWEVDRWFEDDAGRAELEGFLQLCGPFGTQPRDDPFPLLAAIQKSRTKQGELSQVLGEQTRQAVEKLLKALDKNIRDYPEIREILSKNPSTLEMLSDTDQQSALYQASIRLIMRLVVVLFAEARGLLPTDQVPYYESYGIGSLYESLKVAASVEGEVGLSEQFQAWSRLLSLFRLLFEGSDLPDLPMPAYGGHLFQSGDSGSQDVILRALSLYEDERAAISDLVIFEILKLLKVGKIKAKVGRSTKMVSGAVDFSDLRTEYIGMMYEGLLDYQLRIVKPEEEAIIFLNVGNQPALPFSLLKELSDAELKDLIKKLGKEQKEESVEGEDEAEEEEEQPEEIEEEESGEEEEEAVIEDSSGVSSEIILWAERVVEVAGLVKRPKGKNADPAEFARLVRRRARSFISEERVVLAGEMYLIRASGTRKGSGSFYTKPQLAVPTVHRTLEPLVYNIEGEGIDRKLTPKKPEEILALKVCDPAMGSASFLVAALRFLSDALYESLWYHDKVPRTEKARRVLTLPFGDKSSGAEADELFPCRSDEDAFESRTKARLKRYVVERCIYGVDLNPVAVELGKLSLWIETMDQKLPFSFLDHKIHVGNSLVGCWLDQVSEYPVMAWNRETGDEKHTGVNHQKKTWADKLKAIRENQVKPEMIQILQAGGISRVDSFTDERVRKTHTEAVRALEAVHNLSICDSSEQRELVWRGGFIEHPDIIALKEACDLWCAVWFWPGKWYSGESGIAPTPNLFYQPTEEIKTLTRQLAEEMKFFHWELMFPEVFVKNGGFDAIIGNPPWEISKATSHEFFTVYDPIFRTRGKQEALNIQTDLFSKESEIETAWLHYCGRFKEMGNWVSSSAFPFGDPSDEKETFSFSRRTFESATYHERWRIQRRKHESFTDLEHPFRHQGSADVNTYKLFLELSHSICNDNGRIGMIVPSGIYTDNGTVALRDLFINRCNWEFLFVFENRRKIFPIDSRFKYCPVIINKGGKTTSVLTAFMQHDSASWENPWKNLIEYTAVQVHTFSPNIRAFLEIKTHRDIGIINKIYIYTNSVLLGENGLEGWGIKYTTEFHMTNDSYLFPPLEWWKELGYTPDEYGRWHPPEGEKPELVYKRREIGSPGDMALPLYQGRMIHQFDYSYQCYVDGSGNRTNWKIINFEEKNITSQYLIAESKFALKSSNNLARISFRDIARTTDLRTMICSIIPNYPCGNKVPLFIKNEFQDYSQYLSLVGILNSYIFDYILRIKQGSTSLNYYILAETPLVKPNNYLYLYKFVLGLNCVNPIFAPLYTKIRRKSKFNSHWKSLWAITPHERLRLRCILDSIIAHLYGLEFEDFAWILKDCAHPTTHLRSIKKTLDPKGFWRVDQTEVPELRHPVLALKAFLDLKKMGLEEFCALNDGDGWMIPDEITYATRPDGTIEFDTTDGITVPVREKLGPRFLDWQLEGTPEESWAECERHARAILGDEEFERMMKDPDEVTQVLKKAEGQRELDGGQTRLF
nr:hypothetical protein [uncultured Methanospirillum sp.]